MSVASRSNSEKELSIQNKGLWMSKEEFLRKSMENLLSAKYRNRPRSCSPNLHFAADDNLRSAIVDINKPKIQAGMDKYITVIKCQRSSKSAQASNKAKISKDDNTGMISSQHRFAFLQTKEPITSKKSFKPPPIYMKESASSELVRKICLIIGEDTLSVTFIKHGNINETKIQFKNKNYYRKLSNELEKDKKEFYTYQLKSAKGLKVVIKDIDSLVSPEEIKAGLLDKDFKVKNVMNIRNREKTPEPMLRVELEPGDVGLKRYETHPIYDL